MKLLNLIKLKDFELEGVTGGEKISSIDRVTNNYKSRIAMTIDLAFTTIGTIIGGISGVSCNYSRNYDARGNIINTSLQLNSPSIGASLVYASAGGLIGHKIANAIYNKLIY